MIALTLQAVQVQVADTPVPGPDGQLHPGKTLAFLDPQSGIAVSVPLNEDAARTIAAQLGTSGLVVAGPGQVPAPNGRANGHG